MRIGRARAAAVQVTAQVTTEFRTGNGAVQDLVSTQIQYQFWYFRPPIKDNAVQIEGPSEVNRNLLVQTYGTDWYTGACKSCWSHYSPPQLVLNLQMDL